jgi:hypothetical protein
MRNIIILFFIFPHCIFSQKCGVIANIQTKVGIPYVTISVINKPLGTLSDSKGNFCFETQSTSTDSIFVSALGYESKKILFKQYLKSDTIFLIEKNIILDEVVVKSKKNIFLDLGNFHKRWIINQTVFNPNSNQIITTRIENKNRVNGIINSLHFRLEPQKSDFIKKFRLRCRIFKNGENDIPFEDILNDNIIVDVTPYDKYINIDISSYNISFDSKYLWIGIQSIGYIDKQDQYISISEHQYGKVNYKKNKPKKVDNVMLLSPSFPMNNQGIGKSKNIWNKYWNDISTSKNNTPLFGLTLIN